MKAGCCGAALTPANWRIKEFAAVLELLDEQGHCIIENVPSMGLGE
jgi:hypothetical protein